MSSHIITDSGVLPRDVCFDHSPVFVNIRLNSNIKNKSYKRKVSNVKNADCDKFRTTHQNISWNEILTKNDVNETTSILMKNIIKAAEACIPRYDITVRPKDKTWFSGDLRRLGGGPRVVVSTAAFHARVRGSVPGLGGLKETKMFFPYPRVKVSIVGSLRDREVACSASDRQGLNFESCVWRTVSSQSSNHPQEVLLAQFSLYVHKGGLKPGSFPFISLPKAIN